jgi:hypothetical protein
MQVTPRMGTLPEYPSRTSREPEDPLNVHYRCFLSLSGPVVLRQRQDGVVSQMPLTGSLDGINLADKSVDAPSVIY